MGWGKRGSRQKHNRLKMGTERKGRKGMNPEEENKGRRRDRREEVRREDSKKEREKGRRKVGGRKGGGEVKRKGGEGRRTEGTSDPYKFSSHSSPWRQSWKAGFFMNHLLNGANLCAVDLDL